MLSAWQCSLCMQGLPYWWMKAVSHISGDFGCTERLINLTTWLSSNHPHSNAGISLQTEVVASVYVRSGVVSGPHDNLVTSGPSAGRSAGREDQDASPWVLMSINVDSYVVLYEWQDQYRLKSFLDDQNEFLYPEQHLEATHKLQQVRR